MPGFCAKSLEVDASMVSAVFSVEGLVLPARKILLLWYASMMLP